MVSVSPEESLKHALAAFIAPKKNSHKGQNGKLLVIGGSATFHAASIWAAAAASRIVDMVHYASTEENEKIFLHLKSHFVDGIVIHKKDLLSYVEEDDCILIGPGMERGKVTETVRKEPAHFADLKTINDLTNETDYTYALIRFLITTFPTKKFVFDAAALQMMEPTWLLNLTQTPILTPHCREFETLFNVPICTTPLEEKKPIIIATAAQYRTVILFKQIVDIITDGEQYSTVTGGNAGLTKGGSGDVLAGLTAAFYATNDAVTSALLASYLVKKSAEDLFTSSGIFYTTSDLIHQLSKTAKPVLFDN